MKKNSALTLMLLTILSWLIGCKSKDASCQSCTGEPNLTKQVSFLGKSSATVNLGFWKINDRKVNNYYYDSYNARSVNDFSPIKKYLLANILNANEISKYFEDQNLYAISFFTNADIISLGKLQDTEIRGFSIYYLEDKKLYHRLFIMNKGNAIENNKLFAETDGITINYLHAIAIKLFYDASLPLHTIVVGITDSKFKLNIDGNVDELGTKLKKYFSNTSLRGNQTEKTDPDIEGICGSPCIPSEKNPICNQSFPTGNYYCKKKKGIEGDCLAKSIDQIIVDNEGSNPGYSSASNSLYNLRDNFLVRNSKGISYIEKYYYIGSIIIDNIDYTLAKDCFELLSSEGIIRINNFISNSNETQILYDDIIKNKIINILRKLDALSNDDTYKKYMGSFITETELFSNKSIAEIKSSFK